MTALLSLALTVWIAPSWAFNSGSNGSDGALDYSALPPGSVVDFDPTTHVPPLDVDGDNTYHFTTITIPANVTVKLRAPKLNWSPVYWLASGAVLINGTLDLNGEDGAVLVDGDAPNFSTPGPGGFPGGYAGLSNTLCHAGFGPLSEFCGSNARRDYSNMFLLPLSGGSGGGGAFSPGPDGIPVVGGGAGGGAILIASNVSITINGAISATGGTGGGDGTAAFHEGGVGSGGGIRLMSDLVTGIGQIDVSGGFKKTGAFYGDPGIVRVEAGQNTFSGMILQLNVGDHYRSVNLPPNPIVGVNATPRVRVTSIDGIAVPSRPGGSFQVPDVTLSKTTPVDTIIQANNIPLGTVVTLYYFNQTTFLGQVNFRPLAGTLQSSTATATTAITHGYSLLWVLATWTP